MTLFVWHWEPFGVRGDTCYDLARAQHFLGNFGVIWNIDLIFVSHQDSVINICTSHFKRAIDSLCSILANFNPTHHLSQLLNNEGLITDDLRLPIILDYYNFKRCLMDLSQIEIIFNNANAEPATEQIRLGIYMSQ